MKYFITGNIGKFKEVKLMIAGIKQLDIDLPEIQEIDPKAVVGAKLKEALKSKDGEFIIEDTSLSFDCLNGLPGPLIKWFSKTMKNDGLFDLCKRYDNYKAEARTIVGYAKNDTEMHFFEGVVDGKIVSPRGEMGFGWDEIFVPLGQEKSFAQMNTEEKNNCSMRRISFLKLKEYLIK